MRRLLPLFVTAIAVLLSACGKNDNSTPNASLRIFHAIPDSTAVSITYSNSNSTVTNGQAATTNLISGVAYQTLSAYSDIPAGTETINVLDSSGGSELQSNYNLGGANQYTLVVAGRAGAAGGVLLQDNTTAPASGNFSLRVVNVGSIAFDVYLLGPGQTVNNSAPILTSVGVSGNSNFAPYLKGTYDIVLTAAGLKTPIYDFGSAAYADQQITTLIAYATGSSQLVNGIVINAANNSTSTATTTSLPANPYTRIKMVQTTPDVPLMDMLVDGAVTFSNVPYQGVSAYSVVNSGSHNFQAQPTATPGTYLASTGLNLSGGKDYTILANGRQGTITLVPLTDVNFAPMAGKARVRVVNAGLGAGSIDVLVNFVKQLNTIPLNTASNYLELDATATNTTYSFTFTTAGTTTGLLTLPSVALTAGTRYTIYLVGNSPALVGVVTTDN